MGHANFGVRKISFEACEFVAIFRPKQRTGNFVIFLLVYLGEGQNRHPTYENKCLVIGNKALPVNNFS